MQFGGIVAAGIDGGPIESLARGASDVGFRTVALPLSSGMPLWEVARRRPQFFRKYLALIGRELRFQWDHSAVLVRVRRVNRCPCRKHSMSQTGGAAVPVVHTDSH